VAHSAFRDELRAPTAATEGELPLANAMGELDAGDRDGRDRGEAESRRSCRLCRLP